MNANHDSLDAQVLAEQVRLAYQQQPINVIGINGTAWLLALALWGNINHNVVLSWLMAVFIVTGLGFLVLYFSYRRAQPSVKDAPLWATRFVMLACLGGITWGAAGIALYTPHSLQHQMILYAFVGGMSAATVVTMAPLRSAYYALIIPIVTPGIIRLAMDADRVHLVLSFTGIFYVTSITPYWKQSACVSKMQNWCLNCDTKKKRQTWPMRLNHAFLQLPATICVSRCMHRACLWANCENA